MFDDTLDQLEIIGFGSDGVDLAVDLLKQEIQFLADRAVFAEDCCQLVEVAVQTDKFFIDRTFVGKQERPRPPGAVHRKNRGPGH